MKFNKKKVVLLLLENGKPEYKIFINELVNRKEINIFFSFFVSRQIAMKRNTK